VPILVSDTSVLIDLERGKLLEEMFRLPFEFAVPDLLYARELVGPLGDRLVALGLRVEVLTPPEVSRATTVRRQNARLSVPDTFAFAIAEARQWTLLTGDGSLRDLAIAEQVEMHGVLWLLDQLADGNHVSVEQLHDGLSAIFAHPRCRLPTEEVQRRLAQFAEQLRRN
jgi:hypothetical protein